MAQIITGIGWHMVGAASAASFYAPISKVKKWTWETTWAVGGSFSWFLLPIGVSLFLLPHFWSFYASLDSGVVRSPGKVVVPQRYSMVPSRPTWRPAAARMASTR